jgi:hypothetical protein
MHNPYRYCRLTARHAACKFNSASVAPGYACADSTTASAHKAAPWLCGFGERRPC